MTSKFRVYTIISGSTNGTFNFEVESPIEAAYKIEVLRDFQLELDSISGYVIGAEYWDEEAGEWFEWMDDEGRDLSDITKNKDLFKKFKEEYAQ